MFFFAFALTRASQHTGAGRQVKSASDDKGQQQQAYLQLALTVLAAFSRLPELASTDDFIAQVPGLVETVGNKYATCCQNLE